MKIRIRWIIVITLATLILVFAPLWAVTADSQPVKSGITNPEWRCQTEEMLYPASSPSRDSQERSARVLKAAR